MNRVVKFLVIFLLFILSLQAKKLEKISLQLQWFNQFQFAGYYIAKEKGFYKNVGLDVEIKSYKEGEDTTKDVLSGNCEYGIGMNSLIIDESKHDDIVLLSAIFQASPLVLVAKKSSNIQYIQSFKNKRIMLNGVEKSASLYAMLLSRDISYKDMHIIKGDNEIKSLIDGDTDIISAYTSNELYTLKQKNVDVTIFDPKDFGFYFYSDILYTSTDEIQYHKDRVIKFKNASLQGWRYAFRHINEAVDLIYKRYNTQKKTKKALRYEAEVLKKLAYYKTKELGKIEKDKIQRVYDIYNIMGYIKKPINLNKFIFENHKTTIDFTIKEKLYIKTHPVIKAHNEVYWPPFNYNEKGKAKGFSVDYMNLLAKKLHLKVKYISGYSWDQFMKILKTPKLDVLINIAKNKKREKTIDFTDSFYTAYSAIYVNSKNPNFNTLNDLNGKKIAMTKGFFSQGVLAKYYPKIKQVLVKNQVKALRLLSLGKVDAVVGKKVVIDFLVAQNNIPNILATNYIEDKRMTTNIRLGVSKKDAVLRDILQKAMDVVTDNELRYLRQKWFGVKIFDIKKNNLLTKSERLYLGNKKHINVCTNPNWIPIEFSANGKPKGISIDIIKIVAKRLGVKLNFIKSASWEESQEFLKEKKCDILPAAIKTNQRSKYALFTKPYLKYNLAIVTKKYEPYVDKLEKIVYKGMSRKKGSGLIYKLKKSYPNMDILETDSYREAFRDVQTGHAYFTISTLPVLSYYRKRYGFGNLQISGYTNMKYELRVAVRKDDITLRNAMDKVLADISPETKNAINEKWTAIHVVQRYDYNFLWKLVLLFLLALMIFIYYYLKQRKLKNKLEKLNLTLKDKITKEVEKNRYQDQKLFQQSRLAQMGEMISMIAHQWRQPLAAISATTSNLKFKIMLDDIDTKVFEEEIDLIDSYSQYLSRTIDDFRSFFKENKKKEMITLEEISQSTLSIVGKSLENKNIDIVKSFNCHKKFKTYQNEIIQVVLNLVKNAEDALLEKKIKNPTITIETICKKDLIILKVKDNAGGVKEEIREKIFDPYFSTKLEKDGTGLGLYMSKIIIEKHCGGKLCVKNDQYGAVFIIKFDLKQMEK